MTLIVHECLQFQTIATTLAAPNIFKTSCFLKECSFDVFSVAECSCCMYYIVSIGS